jgi:hypothetical protein
MRALVQPFRVRMLGELRVSGPTQVGRLAELLDEAPGSISYHDGVLARAGFVVEAPEQTCDARERWWRQSPIPIYEPSKLNADPPLRTAGIPAEKVASLLKRFLVG